MDDTLRKRARAAEDAKKRKRKDKLKKNLEYGLNGKALRGKMKLWKKLILVILCILLVAAGLIYIPPYFYHEASDNSYIQLMPDASALKTYQTYLKDHPDADFDNDGLMNSQEDERGTDIWRMDSDNDGVSDYAELTVTDTSPVSGTAVLAERIIDEDKKNGTSVGTPYKIDDIMMWPDDYNSKAYGGVVRTINGYRFCYFKGWVRFPLGGYAYGYKDGRHYEIPYWQEEDAYYIQTSDEILIYDEPLRFIHKLQLPFVDTIYLEDNKAGEILSNILPDKGGFFNCFREADIDEDPEIHHDVTSPLRLPIIENSDPERLIHNKNTLSDLADVRKQIDAGECVAVSFYSSVTGESIGVVYGYTDKGDLMIADTNLRPAGILNIVEVAMRMMNSDAEIGQVSRFEWSGLGFNSRQGDRINFFSSTVTSMDMEIKMEGADLLSGGMLIDVPIDDTLNGVSEFGFDTDNKAGGIAEENDMMPQEDEGVVSSSVVQEDSSEKESSEENTGSDADALNTTQEAPSGQDTVTDPMQTVFSFG